MKVIDAFTFYNELKMLKFRLTEHNDFVDYFVLVEATVTFAGNPKPLFYQDNKHLFEEFNHKIIHIVVEDMPMGNEHVWTRENFQRYCTDRGIKKLNLVDEDIILISDADEIFDYKYIQALKTLKDPFAFQFNFETYYYDLQHKCDEVTTAPRVLNYSAYKIFNSNPQFIRTAYIFQKIDNTGWHFSYFGDIPFIRNKLLNYAHQEFNNDADRDPVRIQNCIDNAQDIARRHGYKMYILPVEQNTNLPRYYKMLL